MDAQAPERGVRFGSVVEDLADRWRDGRRTVATVGIAALVTAAGVAWWRSGSASEALPPLPDPQPVVTSSTTVAVDLVVHVVGAVRTPGVVRLRDGSRVLDAVGAAGGATPAADLARLNLAAPLADGTRVVVPRVGEPTPVAEPGDLAPPGAEVAGSSPGPIDVNRATAAELEALPGVGPATAAAIVREREEHGPFRSPDDLERVRGIGPAKLAALRDQIRV
ncbi:MAG: ComEA family DNA-binding protein [Actinomycetota bacterium]